MAEVEQFRHAKLLADLRASGATVEDIARAWASLDGKRDEFDAGKGESVTDDETGHYAGYLYETEEVIERAIKYARSRQ